MSTIPETSSWPFFISSPALTRGVPCRVTMESITPSSVENRLQNLSSGSAFSPAVPSRISKRRPVPENPADTQVISGNSLRREAASALQLIFFLDTPKQTPCSFRKLISWGVGFKIFPRISTFHTLPDRKKRRQQTARNPAGIIFLLLQKSRKNKGPFFFRMWICTPVFLRSGEICRKSATFMVS